MFKGTVKRVYKRLKTASNNRQRRLSDHHRLSDHRAVALAVGLTVKGMLRHSSLTGAPGTGSAGACPSTDAAAKEDDARPVLMSPPKAMQTQFDRILKGIDQCSITVTRSGRFAKFGHGWANS